MRTRLWLTRIIQDTEDGNALKPLGLKEIEAEIDREPFQGDICDIVMEIKNLGVGDRCIMLTYTDDVTEAAIQAAGAVPLTRAFARLQRTAVRNRIPTRYRALLNSILVSFPNLPYEDVDD